MKSENTNKGITELSNIHNGLNYSSDLYSYMGILVDMSGILCEDFSTKGWTDRQEVVNVLD